MLIEALIPLTIRLPEGDLYMVPGKPVPLSDTQARKLLAKVPGKVRLVEVQTQGLVPEADLRPAPVTDPEDIGRVVRGTSTSDQKNLAVILAFTCSGCGQAVTQLHKAGDHWQCSHCAGVDAITLPPVAAPPSPCRLCGVNSWWRSGPAGAWLCRRCRPPASLPVYEVLGPYGKPGDAVKTQPRADALAWEAAWRELWAITDGITEDDSRVQPVMAAIEQCDTARLAGDWPAFHQAVAQVRLAVQTEHGR